MKNRRKNIYILILLSFIIITLYNFDMGIYYKSINSVESMQLETLTLHNIKYISTIKVGNLKCYEGTATNANDVYFVSCFRKSAFYPLYRTVDIKIIQKSNGGKYNDVILKEQTAYYSISVSGDKFTSQKFENDFNYYVTIFLTTSVILCMLWIAFTLYSNKKNRRKNEKIS